MKKIISSLILFCFAMACFAQTEKPNRLLLHDLNGNVTAFELDNMDYFDFATVGDVSVSVDADNPATDITESGFKVAFKKSDDCASYRVYWYSAAANGSAAGEEVLKVFVGEYTEDAVVDFTGLAENTVFTVYAYAFDVYGIEGKGVSFNVKTVLKPKVGDYFYSDGTWSDGGLVSIDLDGKNAVWAADKPAPIEGKTVVGIVCMTDPSRIAEADKAAGYTHGYVIGCKNATDPGKVNYAEYPESIFFSNLDEISIDSNHKTAKTWYETIDGRSITQTYLDEYGDAAATDVPLFYYCTSGYPVAAPASTSGWFVPSTGQLWDCLANLCGQEVAEFLAGLRSYSYDMTYETTNTRVDVLGKFKEAFSLVPDADKDGFEVYDFDATTYGKGICLRTCCRYSTESACHFSIGNDEKGLFEGMTGWFDEEGHARPFLAF